MSMERREIPTIRIGFNSKEQSVTVSPPAMVVEKHSQVEFCLDSDARATAKVMIPAEDCELRLTPGEPSQVEVTQSGVYYVVVTLPNPGKVGAMAVLICDV